jgi:periplasmic protein TonB
MTHAGLRGASPNAHLLIGEMPAPHQLSVRWWEGTGVSIAVHAGVIIALLYAGARAVPVRAAADRIRSFVFVASGGAGATRGGGATDTVERVRPAEIAPARPRNIAATPDPVNTTNPDVTVPIMTADALRTIPGALSEVSGIALGRGTGPGGGQGDGPGIGRGPGNGVGDGGSEGIGGDAFVPGNGVTAPELILEIKPNYTVDAMRAKLQGVVQLDAVVLPDGSVDPRRIRITRSLDRALGLDDQAIRAVARWRFRPGTLKGRPVPVRISVELTFTLR